MRNLLFYAVFFIPFLMASCGESNNNKAEEPEAVENVEAASVEEEDAGIILFFGNSLTAGMGLEQDESFPAVIQEKIDSLDLPYKVVNAGLSGETTASGKNRINWVINQNVDVFVLELGANDGLRGIPVEETRENLQAIIDMVREENPGVKIILAGMQIPPNMGKAYTSDFKEIFPELARENDIALIPFLLEDVAGNPELNQQDGIHPTAKGQEIVADNVWEVLYPLLSE
ncbi:arylesterase [Salinimicrobium sp. GXAS 041]|uniref:arylesterase n=1 Tax=Salinimicrobium sp. GXAS 041 TaxID=3400806 RepID=UPI003C7838CB